MPRRVSTSTSTMVSFWTEAGSTWLTPISRQTHIVSYVVSSRRNVDHAVGLWRIIWWSLSVWKNLAQQSADHQKASAGKFWTLISASRLMARTTFAPQTRGERTLRPCSQDPLTHYH